MPSSRTIARFLCYFALLSRYSHVCTAFTINHRTATRSQPLSKLNLVTPDHVDLFHTVCAGSLAGVFGVAVAYPFDTIKTRQIMVNGEEMGRRQQQQLDEQYYGRGGGSSSRVEEAFISAEADSSATAVLRAQQEQVYYEDRRKVARDSIPEVIALILREDGIAGFYGGVQTMMISQAIIKALAFTTNSVALDKFHTWSFTQNMGDTEILFAAAGVAGFLASFVVAPLERVCVLMQASRGSYKSEWDCLQTIIRQEGVWGWLTNSGWTVSLMREMPSDMIYFGVYGVLMQSVYATMLPHSLTPLAFGAIAGMASWLPVYPIDVVKTVLQNNDGTAEGRRQTAWEITQDLYRKGGVMAFFEGLDSKLIRAGLHHAATFAVFDAIIHSWH